MFQHWGLLMQSSTHGFFYDICLLLLVFLPVEFADILLFKKKFVLISSALMAVTGVASPKIPLIKI